MARVKVVGLAAAYEKALIRDEGVKEEIHSKAKEAQEYWKSIAPVGSERDKHSGAYRDSIEVRPLSEGRYRIQSKDFKAHWIEYGSVKMPKYACMEKTRMYMLSNGFHAGHGVPEAAGEVLGE